MIVVHLDMELLHMRFGLIPVIFVISSSYPMLSIYPGYPTKNMSHLGSIWNQTLIPFSLFEVPIDTIFVGVIRTEYHSVPEWDHVAAVDESVGFCGQFGVGGDKPGFVVHGIKLVVCT